MARVEEHVNVKINDIVNARTCVWGRSKTQICGTPCMKEQLINSPRRQIVPVPLELVPLRRYYWGCIRTLLSSLDSFFSS